MPLTTRVKAGQVLRINGARVMFERNVKIVIVDGADVEKQQGDKMVSIAKTKEDAA